LPCASAGTAAVIIVPAIITLPASAARVRRVVFLTNPSIVFI
jgi:hypothetical protein